MKFIAAILIILPTLAHPAIDPTERDIIQNELLQPLMISIGSPQMIKGHITHVSKDQIHIKTSEGIGEIEFTFEPKQIKGITIPGESYKTLALEWQEAGKAENAHDLMQLLFEQRKALLPLLPATESHFFIHYVRLILKSPEPARAIAVADLLRPQIKSLIALHALDDAILESYYSIALYETAQPLAERWVQSRPPHSDSALGYYILATDKLRNENYEEALQLALQPIVFSSATQVDKLAHCYAVAISAAMQLREHDYAQILYREMQSQKFAWPIQDPTLAPFKSKLLKHIEKQ